VLPMFGYVSAAPMRISITRGGGRAGPRAEPPERVDRSAFGHPRAGNSHVALDKISRVINQGGELIIWKRDASFSLNYERQTRNYFLTSPFRPIRRGCY